MALQCKQSQDIVKYTQVPIFSKSRTDLYVFTTLNSNLRHRVPLQRLRLVTIGLCCEEMPVRRAGPWPVSSV